MDVNFLFCNSTIFLYFLFYQRGVAIPEPLGRFLLGDNLPGMVPGGPRAGQAYVTRSGNAASFPPTRPSIDGP